LVSVPAAVENSTADDAAAPAEQAPAEASEPRSRMAALVVTHLQQHITTWPLTAGRISIGRATDNELRLDAPYISRHHCQVVTVGNVSTIEDLDSVNGISVNGKLAKLHVLRHADQIALGQHVLTYVESPQT
jgi:pSer/pThr/pTyr-binding forkhead associated (FHA) protein